MHTSEHSATDNGLGLAGHAFLLFVSIVFSVLIHFGVMYACGEIGVNPINPTKKAHITPENLPPMQIEAFVQEVNLIQAEIVEQPDIESAAEQASETLSATAAAAAVPLPSLSPAALPADIAPGTALAPIDTKAVLPVLPPSFVRQEIAAVPETDFTKSVNPDPRWTLDAATPRVPDAPDLAASVESPLGAADALGAASVAMLPPLRDQTAIAQSVEQLDTLISSEIKEIPHHVAEPIAEREAMSQLADAAVSEAISQGSRVNLPNFRAIDDRLSLALTSYETSDDSTHRYFRLDVLRRPDSPLPIMAKDVIFIQDISGSIGKARLAAAKEAMKSALFNILRVGDRFNIFAFRDVTLTPSAEWLTFNPDTRVQAETFIDSLRARGNTDLFLLLQDLLTLKRDPMRPLIAIVITDGEATVGVTETTRIIGEFSRVNKGQISIYSFGAKKRDPYFLDMLCYVNRGENTSASGHVSEMSAELAPVFESIRNPVMKDISLTFHTAGGGEIHPRNLTNLYADRTLTLYGRVPKETPALTCQLRGLSGEAPYDAVFSFPFNEATESELDLRRAWAERAMFDLLAEYAENPSEALLNKINTFSKTYDVPNPYKTK